MNKNELMGKRVGVSKKFLRTSYPKKEYWETAVSLTGWIVGFRTIQNGYSEWVDEYVGYMWNPTSYIKCVLVSLTPHQNPIKVPLDGFEVTDDQ